MRPACPGPTSRATSNSTTEPQGRVRLVLGPGLLGARSESAGFITERFDGTFHRTFHRMFCAGAARQRHACLLANATADLHRQIAGNHGFLLSFDCGKISTGRHKLLVEAFYEGQWVQFSQSPVCLANGNVVPCGKLHLPVPDHAPAV